MNPCFEPSLVWYDPNRPRPTLRDHQRLSNIGARGAAAEVVGSVYASNLFAEYRGILERLAEAAEG